MALFSFHVLNSFILRRKTLSDLSTVAYLYQIDFKLDLNMDRMVSRDEYVRALSRSNDLEWSHKPYWTNWLTVDASDPELLSWGHIHER